tara:strand:+ start:601 stop:828 length:228 start_codon:yes stop_codon:yes gene_type:complete
MSNHDHDEYIPHVDDVCWVDKKGTVYNIEDMDIAHVEACIRFLANKGFKAEIPKAFFKRFNERHKVLAEEFEDLT